MAIAPSVMLQVELAMYAALAAPGTPAARTDRGNTGEYSADVMPAYNLALEEFANGYGARETDRESLRVSATWLVFCYAAANGATTAADAADPLMTWAHQQLADNPLSGLSVSTQVRGGKLNWNEQDGRDTVEVLLSVEVMFDIARSDPSQNGN